MSLEAEQQVRRKKGGCAVKNHCTSGGKWRAWCFKEAYRESKKVAVVKPRYKIDMSRRPLFLIKA